MEWVPGCTILNIPSPFLLHLYQSFFMSILRQISEYLYLRKPDPNEPRTQWMKYMHGINRLSILLFLVAMVILAIKLLRN
jgi:hypothetical protein